MTYTLDRHLPQSVTLQTTQHQGPPASDGTAPIVTDFDQNPVFVELQPLVPPKKMRKPPPKKRVAQPKPPPTDAAAPPPAPSPPRAASRTDLQPVPAASAASVTLAQSMIRKSMPST